VDTAEGSSATGTGLLSSEGAANAWRTGAESLIRGVDTNTPTSTPMIAARVAVVMT
jgi:hypothetical protein